MSRFPGWRGKSKYKNIPTEYNGHRYASKLEAECAAWLDNRWHIGEILWYTRQTRFDLEGGVRYIADFLVCLPKEPNIQVIDATGLLTQTKKNKLKQVRERYGLTCLLYRRGARLTPFTEA